MDPMTLLFVVLAVEVLAGGPITAVTAGAVVGTARQTVKDGKKAYKKRAKQLRKTPFGRWQLKWEARAIGAGVGLWRGVRHGAPQGVRDGLAVRRRALRAGRTRAKTLLSRQRRTQPVPDTSGDTGPTAPPAASGDGSGGPGPVTVTPPTPPAPVPTPRDGTTPPQTPDTRQDTGPSTTTRDTTPTTPTEAPPVTTQTSTLATPEVTGAASYVAVWETASGWLESAIADVTGTVDELTTAAEHGADFDPGGSADVIGSLQAAVEALNAAKEAVDTYTGAVHSEHDAAVEATSSAQSTAGQTYHGQS